MFEGFTERARQVLVFAQEEARALNHDYIGTEHILLGLLRQEQGLAARVLESLDITVEHVRAQVVRIVGSGEEVSSGSIPFTPRAEKVLELTRREAQSLGQNRIDTEHILLGLADENEGVAVRILLDFDVDSDKLRDEVIRVLPRPFESPASRGSVAEPAPSGLAEQPLAAQPDLELGWRGRSIALAALGGAVLARMAFDRSKTGPIKPLAMQVLARLTLGPPDTALAQPGELFDSLAVALACDRDELQDAVRVLTDQRLVKHHEEQDGDQRISITTAGVTVVQTWLEQTTPLFGSWPPDHPAADDAVG